MAGTLCERFPHLVDEDCASPHDWSRIGNDFVDMIAKWQNQLRPAEFLQICKNFCSVEESARNATRSQLSFLVELAQTSLSLSTESHDPEGITLNELGADSDSKANDASLAAQLGPEFLSHSISVGKFSARLVGDLVSWLIAVDLTSPCKFHASLLELVIGFCFDGHSFPLTEHQADGLFLARLKCPAVVLFDLLLLLSLLFSVTFFDLFKSTFSWAWTLA